MSARYAPVVSGYRLICYSVAHRRGTIESRLSRRETHAFATSLPELRRMARNRGWEFISESGLDSKDDALKWARVKKNRKNHKQAVAWVTAEAVLRPGRQTSAHIIDKSKIIDVYGQMVVFPRLMPRQVLGKKEKKKLRTSQ